MSSLDGLLGSGNGMGAAKLQSRHHKKSKGDIVMTSHFKFEPRSFGIILAEFILVFERPSACDEIQFQNCIDTVTELGNYNQLMYSWLRLENHGLNRYRSLRI